MNATTISTILEGVRSIVRTFSETTISSINELPNDCQELWEPYCHPDPDDNILPSPTSVSSSCEPSNYASSVGDITGEAATLSQETTIESSAASALTTAVDAASQGSRGTVNVPETTSAKAAERTMH